MSELHSWLSTQHHGRQTYKFLKQKLIGRASSDPEHAAQSRKIVGMLLRAQHVFEIRNT
jgi:hypothetical protein